MPDTLHTSFRGEPLVITFPSSVSESIAQMAIESEIFQTWLTRCSMERDGKRLDLNSVEIQHVDMFGSRVGFVKLNAECYLVGDVTKNKRRLPGICFLRGGAVAILIVLICSDDENKAYSILVQQPRVPIGHAACLELPAGMIDNENDGVSGTAAREIEEECGFAIRASELIDLTALSFDEGVKAGKFVSSGIAPSPGGCDEFIRYMYLEKTVKKADIVEMQGRMTGLQEEGEYITLRITPLDNIWKISADSKAICALFLAERLRREGKLPPIGGFQGLFEEPFQRMFDGRRLPSLAFGLYKVPGDAAGVEIISDAIEAGFRHFDGASLYGNERALGRAIQLSLIPREEFILCTKIWNDAQREGPKAVRKSVEKSLWDLGLQYLDIVYIHWPVPDYFVDTYKVLQELVAEGIVRYIGLSNFGIPEYEELMASDGITVPPAVNQIEISPFMYRPNVIEYFQERGIVMIASKALHRAAGFEGTCVSSVAKDHEKTPAQVMLAWGLKKGLVVIAKTSSPHRMSENRQCVNVSLSNADVEALDGLTSEEQIRKREKLELERRRGV